MRNRLLISLIVCGTVSVTSSFPIYAQERTIPTPRAVKAVVSPWIEKFEPPGSLVIVHIDNELIIDKNGGLAGTSTYIGMIPARHLGVVVLANRGKAEATGVGRRLLITLAGGTAKDGLHGAEEHGTEPEDAE